MANSSHTLLMLVVFNLAKPMFNFKSDELWQNRKFLQS
jgi:hypothetical protein